MYSFLQNHFRDPDAPRSPISGLTLAEDRLNAWVHGLGLLLFIGGTAWMIVQASFYSNASGIVGASIFGGSLIVLYAFSTAYHGIRDGRWKGILQVADHVSIYLLIAGTYTPFTLVILPPTWGWSIFGVIWGMALLGVIFKLFFTGRFRLFSTALYVVMGWTILIAIVPLHRTLNPDGMTWLVIGGVSYSVGALFYIWDERFPYFHTVFHALVLVGSLSHFWAVIGYVI